MTAPCMICRKPSTLRLYVKDENKNAAEVLLCDDCLESFKKKDGNVLKKIKEAVKNGRFSKH